MKYEDFNEKVSIFERIEKKFKKMLLNKDTQLEIIEGALLEADVNN